MNINQNFGVALHVLTYLSFMESDFITSNDLADSINTNPVIVRTIAKKLANNGLVEIKRGRGGYKLNKDVNDLSLYDVYVAIYDNQIFRTKHSPNVNCPLGAKMTSAIDCVLDGASSEVEELLKKYHISDIKNNILNKGEIKK